MDWGKMIAQYGFPIALAVYLVWNTTQVQAKRDAEIVGAIKEQKVATEALIKTVNYLAIIIARGSGQDSASLDEAKRLVGLPADDTPIKF
jgi:hypothetical protein